MKILLTRNVIITRILWAINGLWLVLGVFIVAFRLGAIIFGVHAKKPDIDVLTQANLPVAPILDFNLKRNPFDPGGGVWQEPKADGGIAETGELKGILLLPGIHRLLTGRGPVGLGGMIDQGKVLDMNRQGVKVEAHDGVTTTLELPGAHRPRLQDLNRLQQPQYQKQGKP